MRGASAGVSTRRVLAVSFLLVSFWVSRTAFAASVADLSISISDGTTTAVPGDSVTYTLVVHNPTAVAASGATVADSLPTTLACTWTCLGTSGGSCTAAGSGSLSDLVDLPPGSGVTYTADCLLSPAAAGTLSNTATVTLAGDPNVADNQATDVDTLTPKTDLTIAIDDGVTVAVAGGSVTYTIEVGNDGPSKALGAVITADFSTACTSVSYTSATTGGASRGPADPQNVSPAGTGNINQTADMPPGSRVIYSATCSIGAGSTPPLTTRTGVRANADPNGSCTTVTSRSAGDPVCANNDAVDSDDIVNPVTIGGTKVATGVLTIGGTVTYTVVLSNSGPMAQPDNPGNEFTDVLPPTLALGAPAASSGTVSSTGNLVTWNGYIAAGGSVTLTIPATILPSATGIPVTNSGTITYDADANGTNETSVATDDPRLPGSGDPTTIFIADPQEIPALSPVGLSALALALAATAAIFLRRRIAGTERRAR